MWFQLSGAEDLQPVGHLALGSFFSRYSSMSDPFLVQLLLPRPTTCLPDKTLLPAAWDNAKLLCHDSSIADARCGTEYGK